MQFYMLNNFNSKISSLPYFNIIFYIIYWSLSITFIFLITSNANWTFGDDVEWLATTAIGKVEPMTYHMTGGRFVPLAHYDFNILTLFEYGQTPLAHYTWVAISFFVFAFFWLKASKLLPQFNTPYPLTILLSILFFLIICLNISTVFLNIIYPERLLIVLLTIFLYNYLSAIKTGSTFKYITAFICVIYASYMKEPVSGAFTVLAITNLLAYKNLSTKEKIFYGGIILNFIIYMILYYLLVYSHTDHFYNQGRVSIPYLDMIIGIISGNILLFILMLLLLIRVIYIICFKDFKHIVFDGLLFMAVSYTCAYMILKLNQSYYFIPTLFIGLFVLFYWSIQSFKVLKPSQIILPYLCILYILINYSSCWRTYKINQLSKSTFMPLMVQISSDYNTHNFKFFHTFKGKIYTFNDEVILWQKHVLNQTLNYILKTQQFDYFKLINSSDILTPKEILFISAHDKNKSDEVNDWLSKQNFIPFLNFYGLTGYKFNDK